MLRVDLAAPLLGVALAGFDDSVLFVSDVNLMPPPCLAIASLTSLAEAIDVSIPIPIIAKALPIADVSQFST